MFCVYQNISYLYYVIKNKHHEKDSSFTFRPGCGCCREHLTAVANRTPPPINTQPYFQYERALESIDRGLKFTQKK